jgi:hypothetical protein
MPCHAGGRSRSDPVGRTICPQGSHAPTDHRPYRYCIFQQNGAATAGYAAEALWKNICKHYSTAPVTHDCYLKLFYLQCRELAPRDWTVMLDEAEDADPVIFPP